MPRRRGKTMRKTGPTNCDDCRARIVFVTMTATSKSVPVDPIPVDDGNVSALTRPGGRLVGYVISEAHPPRPDYSRYAAHFGTCPSRQKTAPKPAPEPAPTLFEVD